MTEDYRGLTIEWADNPLATRVRLDDYGRLRLRYGLALDGLSDAEACMTLERSSDKPKSGSWLDSYEYHGVADLPSAIDERAGRLERELLEMHCGDCTCVPASCVRCYAESLLGIDTIQGLSKYAAHYVELAFRGERRTTEEAMRWLIETPIAATWAGWEQYLDRWTRERDQAVAWLTRYAETRATAGNGHDGDLGTTEPRR